MLRAVRVNGESSGQLRTVAESRNIEIEGLRYRSVLQHFKGLSGGSDRMSTAAKLHPDGHKVPIVQSGHPKMFDGLSRSITFDRK